MNQFCSAAMVGVAVVQCIGQNDAGTQAPQHLNNRMQRPLIYFEKSIAQVQIFAVFRT